MLLQQFYLGTASFCGICLRFEYDCDLVNVRENSHILQFFSLIEDDGYQPALLCRLCTRKILNTWQIIQSSRRASTILQTIAAFKTMVANDARLYGEIEAQILDHQAKEFRLQHTHIKPVNVHCQQCTDDNVLEGALPEASQLTEQRNTVVESCSHSYPPPEGPVTVKADPWEEELKEQIDFGSLSDDMVDSVDFKLNFGQDASELLEVELKPSTSEISVDSLNHKPHKKRKNKDKKNKSKGKVKIKVKREQRDESEGDDERDDTDGEKEKSLKLKIKKEPKDDTTKRKKSKMNQYIPPEILKAVKRFHLSEPERLKELAERAGTPGYIQAAYKCDQCVLGFMYNPTYEQHMKRHQASHGPHHCKTCGLYFKSEKQLGCHSSSHYTRYRCTLCPYVKPVRDSVIGHCVKSHHEINFDCPQCPKKFRTPKQLKVHIKAIHANAEKSYKCRHCGKALRSKQYLRMHIQTQHYELEPDVSHSCDSCPESFATRVKLEAHRRRAHGAGGVCCDVCGKLMRSPACLVDHMRRMHTDRRLLGDHICDYCGRNYSIKADLALHITWNHMRIGFACAYCNHLFRNRFRLNRHVRVIHENQQSIKTKMCDVCGKGFATNNQLLNHTRTHTGERPYRCAECNSSFAQSSTLQTHMRLVHQRLTRSGLPKEVLLQRKLYHIPYPMS